MTHQLSTEISEESGLAERYCRVTVFGSRSRADLALATGQSIGSLLPEIAGVLNEPPGPYRMALVTTTGVVLSPNSTLAGAKIYDGAALQLLIEEQLPLPPIVNDITEETAADLDSRPDRFGDTARKFSAVTLAAVGPAAMTVELWRAQESSRSGQVFLWVAAAIAAAAAAAAMAGRTDRRWLTTIMAIAATVFAVGAAELGAHLQDWAVRDRLGMGVTLSGLGALAVGRIWRSTGASVGSVVGVISAGSWWALGYLDIATAETDALVVVGVLVTIGALPRWATVVSGLASLDDQRSAGQSMRRPVVRRTLGEAHQTLVTATVALSVLAGITGCLLGSEAEPWSIALATAACGVLLLRARAFPLTAEVVPLAAAGAAIAGSILTSWAARREVLAAPIAVTLGLTALGTIAVSWRPSAHVRVRLRQLGDRLEAFAVIALIPSLLGIFGVYERLLHTF
jgi:type VII secretion integral membrane protein EccD